jgi:Xaa-Pro aminopeptidase
MSLHQEKAAQAGDLLRELDLDCWLTFVRETGERPDPGVDMLLGASLTWTSALLLGRGGERMAIVGRYDVENVKLAGVFDEVQGYDENIAAPLIAALERLGPRQIGLNYSRHDHTADGLTVGMYEELRDLLAPTPFAARLASAEGLLSRLRARKTAAEVQRVAAAVATTEEIVAWLTPQIVPGVSEAELAELVHAEFARRGLPSAWDWQYCPTLSVGPGSPIGHVAPQPHIVVEPGSLVHIDLGVRQDDYCSDLQRMWYVRRPGEQEAPAEIQRAMATVVAAIEAGAAALRPGVKGGDVDAAARRVIVEAGYPEYRHAFGHGLGRACHDGGPLLGPRWPRYGAAPDQIIEEGHIYTLELDVPTPAGHLAIEEDVVVTADGCRFLSTFQRELMLI